MSINLYRSPRKTDFNLTTTPAQVGPGHYEGNKTFGDNRDNVAPFLSMKERVINDRTNENPGPGAYDQKNNSYYKSDDKPNNIFTTKIPRFCPTAPGSTVFKYPSSIYNPGPGTYFKEMKWDEVSSLTRIKQNYDKQIHGDLVIKPQGRAPSIPAKKVATNAYSGLGMDTVGPACYNPKEDQLKLKQRKADFVSSKITRKVFEPNRTRENNLPSKENPGPGQYEAVTHVDRKNFNSQGQSAVFLSKVPNCKDIKIKSKDGPGPGFYDKSVTIDQSILSDHKRSNSESGITPTNPNNAKLNQPFMSTTKREDFWVNRIDAPYTHPSHIENPGPGKYNFEKKKDDIKAKILSEDTLHIPFGASEERGCNKKVQKQQIPGPGSYIDINNPQNSSVSKPLLKFSNDRTFAEAHGIKLGAFGTNQKRFEKGEFEGKVGPGPGYYDFTLEKSVAAEISKVEKSKIVEAERPTSQSVFFKSTTDRFVKIDGQNPNIRILETAKGRKTVSQGKISGGGMSLNVTSDSTRVGTSGLVSYLHRGPNWTKQMRATDYEAFSGKRVGFDVTSPRFNTNQIFYGQSLKLEVPGPGKYQEPDEEQPYGRPKTYSQPRNKHLKYAVVFNTCERRFKNKGQNSYIHQAGTGQVVGPGAYISNENSMIKKSFNMSMEHSYFL